MGSNMKALKSRIRSVDSTLHLTRAMGLVASSKIRRANAAMNNSRDFAAAYGDVVDLLTSCPESARSPYMRKRDTERTRLIVIAGDRGLAGGYNANVFRTVAAMTCEQIIPIGKRACDRYHGAFVSSEAYTSAQAAELARQLCMDYLKGEYDRLAIVSTRYISMMTQEPEITWVLPIEGDTEQKSVGAIFEPDEETILNSAVPDYVAGMIMRAVRESFACEVAARRMAMDSAGKNAQAMIDSMQLKYNRARQGAITQEITEIVAGAGS